MRLKWNILRNSRWQKEKETTKKNKNERGKEESDKHWKKTAIKNSCFLPWRLPCPPQKKKKKIFSVPILKFALVSKKKNESESEKKWWILFERSPEQARTSVTHLFSAHFLWLNCSSWVVALVVSLLVNSNFGVGLRQITPAKKALCTWVTLANGTKEKSQLPPGK